MKIILLQDFKTLGKKDDIVEVSDGYARNFLLPKKIAKEATKSVINERQQKLEKERREREERGRKAKSCRT